MRNEFRFFGTDEHKDSFVIFELNRESAANAYLWVILNDDGTCSVKVNPVSRLFSYADHYVSPYWVKEADVGELIGEALDAMEKMPKDELYGLIREFDEKYNADSRSEKWFEEWDRTEESMWQEVEEAREGSGYWPWKPTE